MKWTSSWPGLENHNRNSLCQWSSVKVIYRNICLSVFFTKQKNETHSMEIRLVRPSVSSQLSVTQYQWLNRLSNFYEIPYGSSSNKLSIKHDFLDNWFSNSHIVIECFKLIYAVTCKVSCPIWVKYNMENLPVMLLNNCVLIVSYLTNDERFLGLLLYKS